MGGVKQTAEQRASGVEHKFRHLMYGTASLKEIMV